MPESAVRTAPAAGPGSASPPLRVAVIGVGRIGRMHAELLAHRVPGLALASVYDAAPEVAQAVGAELGADVRRDASTSSCPRTTWRRSRSARARRRTRR